MRTVTIRTKKRGVHQNGYKQDRRTPSLDLCPHCYAFCCDPAAMSPAFRNKIRERLRKRLCPSCGNPVGFCRCKSTISKDRAGRPIVHNNKKLRAAKALVEARENAYKAWSGNEDALVAALGETAYADILDDLYHHKTPTCKFDAIARTMDAHGLDASVLEPAWTGRLN